MEFDVAILGGGAAGLMCAAWLNAHSTLRVGVIEGNAKPGAKIRISGGGKCNLTNISVTEEHYLGDTALVAEVLKRFDNRALLEWVGARGCRPVLRKGRYYFCPHSAQELIDILLRAARKSRLLTGQKITGVKKSGSRFTITTAAETITSKQVVVATGGASYATVGASDIGLKIAQSFGIAILPFRPALAGMTLQKEQFWMKALSGISLPVTIRVADKTLREDMLFAHRGISGPAVLSASLYWEKGVIEIDFLDGRAVQPLIDRGGNKRVSTALPLPRRFVSAMLEHLDVPDVPCAALKADARSRLEVFGGYRFAPAGTFGFSKAEVSKGGVVCDRLNIPSCESREVDGLYFVGEVVDVTGELGGYNFQWAFSSAVCAAENILRIFSYV